MTLPTSPSSPANASPESSSGAQTGSSVRTIELKPDGVWILDQTKLPETVEYQCLQSTGAVIQAIRKLAVRGAPAIGIAGAFGIVLSARIHFNEGLTGDELCKAIREDALHIQTARPTAVNLAWAIGQMLKELDATPPTTESSLLVAALTAKAQALCDDDLLVNRAIGVAGAPLIPPGSRVLTHCNAGALATVGHGTALGVIRSAYAEHGQLEVYADETRPLLQGARLTVWELQQDNIPVTLITDSMAGSLMQAGKVDLVIVGADRIAANGDTANKIGTYSLAVLANAHQIPFYVAAPQSTLDLSLADGSAIPIEERDPDELRKCGSTWLSPPNAKVYNPAFDVTPGRLISAIITEKGIHRPPFNDSLFA